LNALKGIALAILLFAAVIALDWLWDIYAYERPFKKIVRGDTEARVTTLFGNPYYVSTMPDHVTTSYERGDSFVIADTDIVKTFCYWPWGIGGHYCIGFDADGRVISKGRPPKL
jgi:hypothetical protein